MNSAMEYEVCVLKGMLEGLLRGVEPSDANYDTAQELLAILDRVPTWSSDCVPGASLLREFIGGGDFDKH